MSAFEWVLMICGIVLFAVLLFALIYCVLKKQDVKWIVAAFLVPIVMIGFSQIDTLQLGDNVLIKIRDYQLQLAVNPNDAAARRELASAVREVDPTRLEKPDEYATVAQAHAQLGDTVKALTVVEIASRKGITSDRLQQLRSTLTVRPATAGLPKPGSPAMDTARAGANTRLTTSEDIRRRAMQDLTRARSDSSR